jgi:ubiquinone/menaquinone biosynthesis C-methylase UbiE
MVVLVAGLALNARLFFREIARVLQPRGRAFIVDKDFDSRWDRDGPIMSAIWSLSGRRLKWSMQHKH